MMTVMMNKTRVNYQNKKKNLNKIRKNLSKLNKTHIM